MTESDETRTPGALSRRDAIKKGVVGATVAGVVWNAPRVEGLSLRPNYASAASVPGAVAVADFSVPFGNHPPVQVDFGGQKLGDVTGNGFYKGMNTGEWSVSGKFTEAAGVDGCAISGITADWGDAVSADCIGNLATSFNQDTWMANAVNCGPGGANGRPIAHVTITCT